MKEESIDEIGEHSRLTDKRSDNASCSSVAATSGSIAENSNRYI